MSPLGDADHGPGLRVAQSDVGAVTVCPCGVVTLTLQYLSLRLEPEAFRSLSQMLFHAQTRLDRAVARPVGAATALPSEADDAAPAAPPLRCIH